jgi:hypothetical protein
MDRDGSSQAMDSPRESARPRSPAPQRAVPEPRDGITDNVKRKTENVTDVESKGANMKND